MRRTACALLLLHLATPGVAAAADGRRLAPTSDGLPAQEAEALAAERDMPLRYFRHPYLHTGRDLETKASGEPGVPGWVRRAARLRE